MRTLLYALFVGCGARTAPIVERCDGGTRMCTNACGEGSQFCAGGEWSRCEVAVTERPCSSLCEDGVEICELGEWGRCGAAEPQPIGILTARVRDFRTEHADFESMGGVDRGIVANELGFDDKPVYAGGDSTLTTHGRELFDQWYRDVPSVNVGIDIELEFRPSRAGLFLYEQLEFFPIDGDGFGNETFPHNFHFTLEASTSFLYEGGETFRFFGEDDVWVFINRRLAMDVGGTHSREEANIALDDRAEALGLVVGERYALHLFFAERHTDGSAFSVETSIIGDFHCD